MVKFCDSFRLKNTPYLITVLPQSPVTERRCCLRSSLPVLGNPQVVSARFHIMAEEGWSDLPSDLVSIIAEQLPSADHARFRSVCTAWNLAPPPLHNPPEIPWLMFSPSSPACGSCDGGEEQKNNHDQGKQKHGQQCCKLHARFYSISDNRTYKSRGSHLANIMAECRMIVSYSPGGWLMYMDKVCELQCVHLASGERIHPPSITTFKDVLGTKIDSQGCIIGYDIYGLGDDPFCECDSIYWFYKGGSIIFPGSSRNHLLTTQCNSRKHHSATRSNAEYVIVVAYHCFGAMAFARQGDTSWTLIDDVVEPCQNIDLIFPCQITNFILHEGLLYVVNSDSKTARIEFNSDLSYKSASVLPYNFRFLNLGPHTPTSTAYLVDMDGYLWLMQRKIDYVEPEPKEDADMSTSDAERSTPRTSSFQVFKFDESQTTWVEMDTIGDYAIFVGNNYSLALSTHDFPHLVRDCIYFSDDTSDEYGRLTWWDLGVFNMLDKSVRPFYDQLISMDLPQPTWVMSFPL